MEKVKVSFMDKKATVAMKKGMELKEEAAAAAIKRANDEDGNEFRLTHFKEVR